MSLTVMRVVPAFLLVLMLLTLPLPACAKRKAAIARPPGTPPSTLARLNLYSARVRRSTVTYLRLRLLELREQDLDRARAAIERRLSVDELLRESGASAPPARSAGTPILRRESTP